MSIIKLKKPMETLTSTATKAVSNTKLVIAVFAMFGAGAVALATVPVNQNTWGCYVSVNGANTKIANTFNECHDYYLAREYGGKRDFYKLLKNDGRIISEDKITNPDNTVEVFYKNEVDNKIVTGIKLGNNNIISSNKCQKNTFFGIELYCFNELAASAADHTSGNVIKKDYYKPIIKYLTFLKYSSRPIKNLVVNQTISPFSELLKYKIKIADASRPSYFNDGYEGYSDSCNSGGGAYTGGTSLTASLEDNKFFICERNLDFDKLANEGISELKQQVHMAGVIYHESIHFNPGGVGHLFIKKDGVCVDDKTNRGNADWEANLAYGAQIRYLLDVSQNTNLIFCPSRVQAYKEAKIELTNHLCHPLAKLMIDLVKAPVCN